MSLGPGFAERLAQREGSSGAEQGDAGDVDDPGMRPCVLVVDDEPGITASVAAMLGRDYRVITASSADEGVALLRDNPVAVILTDQRMPGGTGIELLVQSLAIAPEVTRILFTGYSDITAVIDAVNEGHVYRYIAKPWQPEELRAVLAQGIDRFRLVTENRRLLDELTAANAELERRVAERTAELQRQNEALRQARESIEQLSHRDPLTGLINRGWLDEVLHHEAERARRYRAPFCVVMADVDHFKEINDSFGHAAGDQVLRAVATTLEKTSRMTDVVGRYGGEEFMMLLPNTQAPQARVLAERMRVALRGMEVSFRPQPVTASFGVAQWMDGDTIADLVDRADEALYAAKRGGRDRVAGGRLGMGDHG